MSSLSTSKSYAQTKLEPVDFRARLSGLAALPLRLIVGYGFMAHGFAKLSRGPETFAVVLHTLGVPDPSVLAWLTTLTELIGGFCILVGAFVPLVSLPMTIVLLTALFTIHLPYGFFSVKLVQVSESGTKFGPVGYEIILLYLAGLITLVLGGAGSLSIDEWRMRKLGAPLFAKRPGHVVSRTCQALGLKGRGLDCGWAGTPNEDTRAFRKPSRNAEFLGATQHSPSPRE